jgi:transcriptional regulator with XRE-family HTH domain
MKKLGELITECRGERSLRKIAEPSGIAASQLQSIERGILAPTAEIYPKLLKELQPDEKQQAKLEQLYMTIRKTPPPDVCELIINNQNLIPVLRAIKDRKLSKKEMNLLLALIAQNNIKGETNNG